MTTATLNKTFKKIEAEINTTFPGRKPAVRAMVLALLAKEHAFLLGPPGTAKSAMCRNLADRITGANYFEAALSRTRLAEAVLGPINLPELKNTGSFRRKTAGYLPTAHIAFLDELGYMSPVLGHDLLAIMNERVYHEVDDNGRSAQPTPLMTCFAAGNSTPEEESDDARALWDRILFRVPVNYLNRGADFTNMLNSDINVDSKTGITLDDLHLAHKEIDEVIVGSAILDNLLQVRADLSNKSSAANTGYGLIFSDRRWKASIKALKAAAWLNGRQQVITADLMELTSVLWSDPQDIPTLQKVLLTYADAEGDKIMKIQDNLKEMLKSIEDRRNVALNTRQTHSQPCLRKLTTIRKQVQDGNFIDHPFYEDLMRDMENVWNSMFEILLEQPPVNFDKFLRGEV
jgi:MoxR-like ATPase